MESPGFVMIRRPSKFISMPAIVWHVLCVLYIFHVSALV